jgi:hypothetical protein
MLTSILYALHGLVCLWHEAEASEEEEDSGPEIGKVSESTGGGFEFLDRTVESFGHRI